MEMARCVSACRSEESRRKQQEEGVKEERGSGEKGRAGKSLFVFRFRLLTGLKHHTPQASIKFGFSSDGQDDEGAGAGKPLSRKPGRRRVSVADLAEMERQVGLNDQMFDAASGGDLGRLEAALHGGAQVPSLSFAKSLRRPRLSRVCVPALSTCIRPTASLGRCR